MPDKFMLKGNCLLHPSCRTAVTVNMVDLCHECWSKASDETREKIKKATYNWSRGLYTQENLEDTLTYLTIDDPAICASQEPEVGV